MVVAKQAVAASNHSDDYAGYATLLSANATALVDVVRSAYGNTSATQLDQVWKLQNGYLIDYTIGIVTHNHQQAFRVADHVAFMHLGELVEYGSGEQVFDHPVEQRTRDYVGGAFG